jgi:hypothetical protein
MFRPMMISSGVIIIGRGNCRLLLLLMLVKYIGCLDAHVFELVGGVVSWCVL